MLHLCTITTVSHLYKTYALADSLNRGERFNLHVLVVDSDADYTYDNCSFLKLKDIHYDAIAATIINKYKNDKDKLRWCLKAVLMQQLLSRHGVHKVIYLDNDLFFYEDYDFLFGLLDHHSFLLTPHYYKNNPNKEQNWFEANFRVGLYNAGFVGASREGLATLQWWAESCAYRCEKNAWRGLFDDQKYLDLVPIMDERALVLRHKGCNVAGWNTELCPRMQVKDKVLIEGRHPVVFVHFNNTTIREIVAGNDKLLWPYYSQYLAALKKHKADLVAETLVVDIPLIDKLKLAIWKVATAQGF